MMGSVVKSTTCRTSAAKTASSAAMAVAVSSVANRSPAVSNRFHNTLDESDDVSPGLGASCDVSTPAGLDFLRTALHKNDDISDHKLAALHQQQQQHSQPAPAMGNRKYAACSDTVNQREGREVENRNPCLSPTGDATDADATSAIEAARSAAAASDADELPVECVEEIPKWVRIGEKVCFSTVVAAVLIPSAQDMSPVAKRELWWQGADYVQMRVNYARYMQDPSLEDDDVQEEQLQRRAAEVSNPAIPVNTPAASDERYSSTMAVAKPVESGAHSTSNSTATVEGVLVVTAAPAAAPAPLTGSLPVVDSSHGLSGPPSEAGKQGFPIKGSPPLRPVGNHRSVGNGGMSSVVVEKSGGKMSPQHARATRPRSAGPNDQQHLKKLSRRQMDNRFNANAPAPVRAKSHSALRGSRVNPASGARGVSGYRDARHDLHGAPRTRSMPQHGSGGQFYVNGNPAGVNESVEAFLPVHQQQQMRHMHMQQVRRQQMQQHQQQIQRQQQQQIQQQQQRFHQPYQQHGHHMRGGGLSSQPPAFSSGHAAMAAVQMRGSQQQQFSMWRSQLVFAPAIMMQ